MIFECWWESAGREKSSNIDADNPWRAAVSWSRYQDAPMFTKASTRLLCVARLEEEKYRRYGIDMQMDVVYEADFLGETE